MQQHSHKLKEISTKRDLFDASDGDKPDPEEPASDAQPVWLTLATKKHILDKARLIPGKVKVPHSLNTSSNLSICLITTDPQRAVKNAVADPSFPKTLASRITRIIGFSKLKARYRTYESRRQLLSEHDVFLADERIIGRLIGTLGKTFYKATIKRPIPISIAPRRQIDKLDGKAKAKRSVGLNKEAAIAQSSIVAQEIERTLSTVLVAIKPAASIAVRVGWSSFSPEQLAENIGASVDGIVNRFVTRGWRNVKSFHVKGPNTAAIPIWLTPDAWTDESDIRQETDGHLEPAAPAEELVAGSVRKEKRKATKSDAKESSHRQKRLREKEGLGDDKAHTQRRKARLLEQKARTIESIPS